MVSDTGKNSSSNQTSTDPGLNLAQDTIGTAYLSQGMSSTHYPISKLAYKIMSQPMILAWITNKKNPNILTEFHFFITN